MTVPPREAWFRKAGEERESFVKSEAIPVTVSPIEDPAAAKPPEPRGVLTPGEAGPRGGLSPWWLSAALPVAAVVFLLVRRRRAKTLPPPPPAHEIAWEALRRLVAAKLIEAGEVERFFTALSAILREYVERRFAVRAPERTTEEFLREAAGHPALAGRRDGLARFLALADLVKFARHAPEESGVQASFTAVKEFVSQTAEEGSVHA